MQPTSSVPVTSDPCTCVEEQWRPGAQMNANRDTQGVGQGGGKEGSRRSELVCEQVCSLTHGHLWQQLVAPLEQRQWTLVKLLLCAHNRHSAAAAATPAAEWRPCCCCCCCEACRVSTDAAGGRSSVRTHFFERCRGVVWGQGWVSVVGGGWGVRLRWCVV